VVSRRLISHDPSATVTPGRTTLYRR